MKKLFIFLALLPFFLIGGGRDGFYKNGVYMIQSLRHAAQTEIPLFYAMKELRDTHFTQGDWWVIPRDHNKTYRVRARVRSAKEVLNLTVYVPDELSSLDVPFRDIMTEYARQIGFSYLTVSFLCENQMVGKFSKLLESEHP